METLALAGSAPAAPLTPEEQCAYDPDDTTDPRHYKPPEVSPGWPVSVSETPEGTSWRAGTVIEAPRPHTLIVLFTDVAGRSHVRDFVIHEDDPRRKFLYFRQNCENEAGGLWRHTPLYEQLTAQHAELTTVNAQLVEAVGQQGRRIDALEATTEKQAVKRGPNKKKPTPPASTREAKPGITRSALE
jgi:hypothetical protein